MSYVGLMENTMPSRTSFLPDALISVLSEPASLRGAASARRWQAEDKNTRLMPWVTRPHQKAGASPPYIRRKNQLPWKQTKTKTEYRGEAETMRLDGHQQ